MLLAFPANAKTWEMTTPSWVTHIVEKVQFRDEEMNEEATDRRHQITCVALGVYYESRGESPRGQQAVADVIMNRARAGGRFPDTPCRVILQPGQFSFVRSSLSPKGPSWDRAIEIARSSLDRVSEIPYLSFTTSKSLRGFRIGHHVFH